MNVHKAEFVKSAASNKDFINDTAPCIVFAGRSNVGKSSVINRLLNRNNFARVSAVPGKTIHINYYLVDRCYFIDLPGYGYARVADSERRRWGELMESFFSDAARIRLGVQIVDIRHSPSNDDVTMARYFRETGIPYIVVANKADKLKRSEIPVHLGKIADTLLLPDIESIIAFSCLTGQGKDKLLSIIDGCADS